MSEIILHPPEEHLAARTLSELCELWLTEMRVAPITTTTYRAKIVHFVTWWDRVGPECDWKLTRSALNAFEVHLRGVIATRFNAPLSYGTRHSVMRALRMMFRWASKTNRTSKNFGEWVPWPEGAPKVRHAATPNDLARLMVAALDSRQPVRDQAMLAFFIGTGCRLGEVAGLTVADLQMLADGAGTATVMGKRTKANRSGQRAVAFDAVTGRYLVRYLDDSLIVTGPLWLNRDDKPISAAGIYQMVKRTVKRAGLEKQIRGCHDLRRAFATILGMLYPGSPAWSDLIRRQLGHAHYAQTAAYTLVEVDDIRDRIVSPLTVKGIDG